MFEALNHLLLKGAVFILSLSISLSLCGEVWSEPPVRKGAPIKNPLSRRSKLDSKTKNKNSFIKNKSTSSSSAGEQKPQSTVMESYLRSEVQISFRSQGPRNERFQMKTLSKNLRTQLERLGCGQVRLPFDFFPDCVGKKTHCEIEVMTQYCVVMNPPAKCPSGQRWKPRYGQKPLEKHVICILDEVGRLERDANAIQ